MEQSASTDQGRLVAVVFSAADKGPSLLAVVQLTSDYCTIVFMSTSESRPNNIRGGKNVRPSVRPQKVSSISMKFGI